MHRADAETIHFLLPGLLHQFGNLLLTIQGNALTLAPDSLGQPQRAILGATERGSGSLTVLRCLLGDPTSPAGDPYELLERLAELARVPLREAHQLLDVRLPPARGQNSVDANTFVDTVVAAMRHLVEVVPTGVRGRVVLELGGERGGPTVVRLGFEPGAGDLPFPLATAELPRVLAARDRARRAGVVCRVRGRALELEFATGGVSRALEA